MYFIIEAILEDYMAALFRCVRLSFPNVRQGSNILSYPCHGLLFFLTAVQDSSNFKMPSCNSKALKLVFGRI